MKSTNICPKCQSRKIVIIKPKSSSSAHKFMFGSWGRSEKYNRYVCTRCGFTESYAILSDKFQKWAKKNLLDVPEEDSDFV